MDTHDWKLLGKTKHHIMPSGRKIIMEECKCICGTVRFVQRQHLSSGASKNCGCKNNERIRTIGLENKKHGMDGTPIYIIFGSILGRCNRKSSASYNRYGGRGIKCLWKRFEDFYEDMGKSYHEHIEKYGRRNTSIDRIDVNGDYCKENCRWVTNIEQANNMSTNVLYSYKGETLTMAQLARKYNVPSLLLKDRLRKQKWSVEDAIETPKLDNEQAMKRMRDGYTDKLSKEARRR